MPVSTAFPWIMDLDGDEVAQFMDELDNAQGSTKSHAEAIEQMDQAISCWSDIARRNREKAEQERRNALYREIDGLKHQLAEWKRSYERLDTRHDKLLDRNRSNEELLMKIKQLVRRDQTHAVMTTPTEILELLRDFRDEGWRSA